MKTQTSKRSVWLRCLLIFPLLTLTLFSFTKKIEVEKDVESQKFSEIIQKSATKEQIQEYNRLAQHYNATPIEKRIIKKEDLKRLEYLYKLMSKEQRKYVQPFPECPPAPKAVNRKNEIETGFLKINGSPHYFVTNNKTTKYYNKQGYEVSKSGKAISKSQVNASDVIPGQYITKVYTDNEIVIEFKDNLPHKKGDVYLPPPPPPKAPKAPKSLKEIKEPKVKEVPDSPKTPKPPKIKEKAKSKKPKDKGKTK